MYTNESLMQDCNITHTHTLAHASQTRTVQPITRYGGFEDVGSLTSRLAANFRGFAIFLNFVETILAVAVNIASNLHNCTKIS